MDDNEDEIVTENYEDEDDQQSDFIKLFESSLDKNKKNQKQLPKLPRRGKKSTTTCNNNQTTTHLLETSRDTLHKTISQERKTIARNLCHAIWHGAPINQGLLTKVQHQDFHRDIGHTNGKIWLWPEEVLWLMERGVLMLQYCGAPVSLQQAEISGKVYAYLKRLGYIVIRAPNAFHTSSSSLKKHSPTPPTSTSTSSSLLPTTRFHQFLLNLSTPGTCSSFEEVFENLQIIKRIDDDDEIYRNQSKDDENNYTIDYYVYAGCSKFKKKQPGEPTFRVCVTSAESKTPLAFHDFSKIFREPSKIIFAIVEGANIVFISRQAVNFHGLNVKIIGVDC
ncbi:6828_t:CDS:2 [Ambispora gerdemannii]|uniref:6828_t:CDS:1 n=1 Tax=Ambispora gerdemannii TaxID=144530 RepID=A0A9N8V657_9GLOM|nr:6828_t:CDS:2 [Ambispora gerdemannii]